MNKIVFSYLKNFQMQFKQGLNLLVILGENIFLKTHIAGIITEGKNWTGTGT